MSTRDKDDGLADAEVADLDYWDREAETRYSKFTNWIRRLARENAALKAANKILDKENTVMGNKLVEMDG